MSKAINYQFRRSSKLVEQVISARLQKLSLQLGEWIEVNVEDGVAKLTGRVLSPELKQMAGQMVSKHKAILSCHNCIEVMKSWPHPGGFQFALSWRDNNGLREEERGGCYELAA